MYEIFTKMLNMSLSAGILVIAVIFLRLILRKIPKKYICVLWALVAISLVCPVNIPCPMSVFNLLGGNNGADGKVEYFRYNEKTEKPKLSFAVPAIVDDNASPDSITVGLHTSSVYLPAIVHIWISGAAVMLLYSAISYLYLKRQVAASIPGKDNVYICDEIKNPFILGIVSPRVYLPSGMSKDMRDNVIAHERAHLKRRDYLWKPLGFILLAVYWFNPVMWAAYVLFCRDIEEACDERVIQNMDKDGRIGYSEALLACAIHRVRIAVCPLAFGENAVKGRVRRVLNYRKPGFWVGILSGAVCIAAALVFLTSPSGVKAGEKDRLRDIEISYGTSSIYSMQEMDEAIEVIIGEFSTWEGCELHSIAYSSDEFCNDSNIAWMNELEEADDAGKREDFTQCIMFTGSFHTPKYNTGAWNPDEEYTGWEWWLARSESGQWKLMTSGY